MMAPELRARVEAEAARTRLVETWRLRPAAHRHLLRRDRPRGPDPEPSHDPGNPHPAHRAARGGGRPEQHRSGQGGTGGAQRDARPWTARTAWRWPSGGYPPFRLGTSGLNRNREARGSPMRPDRVLVRAYGGRARSCCSPEGPPRRRIRRPQLRRELRRRTLTIDDQALGSLPGAPRGRGLGHHPHLRDPGPGERRDHHRHPRALSPADADRQDGHPGAQGRPRPACRPERHPFGRDGAELQARVGAQGGRRPGGRGACAAEPGLARVGPGAQDHHRAAPRRARRVPGILGDRWSRQDRFALPRARAWTSPRSSTDTSSAAGTSRTACSSRGDGSTGWSGSPTCSSRSRIGIP